VIYGDERTISYQQAARGWEHREERELPLVGLEVRMVPMRVGWVPMRMRPPSVLVAIGVRWM
jgi:hypothetical protein